MLEGIVRWPDVCTSPNRRFPLVQQRAVGGVELDHDRLSQGGARYAVTQYDPARAVPSLPPTGIGDRDRLIIVKPPPVAGPKNGDRAITGIIAQNATGSPGRILSVVEGREESGA